MDPIQALLLQANQQVSSFPANSRYHRTATQIMQAEKGEEVVYLKRRFIPQADTLRTIQQHMVKQSERLDRITFEYLNDPELFWQICDANEAMHPLELTEQSNRLIRITMPEGL